MTPAIVVLDEGSGLGLRQVRWRDRLVEHARSSALDRELAAGASPESNVPLAVHAERLCRPAQRRQLACSLMRIAAAAEEGSSGRCLRAPVAGPAVRRARAELAAVAGRLGATGPVDVRGVARLRALLADGTGPLYRSAPPEQLRHELAAVLDALDSFG